MGIRSLLRNAFGRSKATREETGAASSSAGTPESATIPEAREESAPAASPKSAASATPSEAEVPAARTAPTEHPTPTTATLPAQGSPVDRAATPVRENEEAPQAKDDDKPEARAPEADTAASDLVSQAFDNPAPATKPEPATSQEEPPSQEEPAEAPQPATAEAEAPTEPAAETVTEAVTPEPKSDDQPEAETKAEPEPEAKSEAEAEPVQDVTPEPAAETEAEAAPKAEAATETQPAAETVAAPKAADTPNAEATPEPTTETAPEPTAETAAEPTAETAAEPTAETAAKSEPTPEPEATKEPEATPEPEATKEPEATPEPEVVTDAPVATAPQRDGIPDALLPLHAAAGATLEKHGLTTQRAVVYLVLDRSGSMRNYYKDGTVQNLAEQALALAAHFDDDPTVPVVFFSTDIDGTADLDLGNYEGRIEELHAGLGHMGRTNYHWAINAVVEHYKKSGTTAPAFVIFQTDGAPTSKPAAEKALCEAAKLPIFWQFIGFGDPEAKGFDFLRKLDDLTVPEKRAVDNAGFFHAGREPRSLSHDALYQQLMVEFPEWLTEARTAKVLKDG
ncbi:VWA domain-containing protein [Streptomyces sp. NPDC021749]|uniref:VWA domain-containing protein n=1 Tax=Streptomyces sp. NPDC021749 TaxID=3154905 RepID=UPI0033BFBDF8